MYEMEGPSPGPGSHSRRLPDGRLPGLRPLPGHHRPGHPPGIRSPGSPTVSGSPPDSVSAFGGECVSNAWARVAQGVRAGNLKILRLSTGHAAVIPCVPAVVHPFVHIAVHRPRWPPPAADRPPGLRRQSLLTAQGRSPGTVTDRVLTDAASALMRHNRWQHNSDEAPPCMRWRGLARPAAQHADRSAAGCPAAVRC